MYGNKEISPMSDMVLKESLLKLRNTSKFSDVKIKINEKEIMVSGSNPGP